MKGASRLHALAFFSGAAALVYEVCWTRLLSLTFGSSSLAASTAVAGFMGGMGIGAWLYHRIESRVSSPLRLYAAIEVAIAVAAAAMTLVLWGLPTVFAELAAALGDGASLTAARIVGGFAVMLIPTALMGATYPALCAAAIDSDDALDRHLGALYGWNTVGAACGALAGGIVAIPLVGLSAAVAIGVIVNLAVAGAALALSRAGQGRPAERPAEPGTPASSSPTVSPRWLIAIVLFASGFATLAYEIVWFRALRYLVGNSTFAFTVVLVVFLLGLGFGALGLKRVLDRGQPERDLGLVQFAIAACAALAIGAEVRLVASDAGYSISAFNSAFHSYPWWWRLATHASLALALMLPATLLMGLSFPLASRLFVGGTLQIGRRVGQATLLANLGSIAGSIGAATWLLPAFGSLGATKWLIGLNLAIGCLVLTAARGPGLHRWRLVTPAVLVALGVAWLLPARVDFAGGQLGGLEARLLFQEEGDLATVQVSEAVSAPALMGITIDGTTIGVTAGWNYPIYSKQRLLAHLPLVIEPRIRSVVQIGLGSASTLEALTRHAQLERIDAVEISGAVVRGSRYFDSSRALDDPRVGLYVEDAIHHLLRLDEPVDLIVSDGKQNDDFSGNGKILSREFYELALASLADHGVFVQWLGLSMRTENFSVVLRTAASVFPHLDVFFDFPSTVVLVGGWTPLGERTSMTPEAYRAGPADADLRSLGISSRGVLRYGWIADRASLVQVLGDGPLNTWDRSFVEYAAYRGVRRPGDRHAARNLGLLRRANALSVARAPSGFAPRRAARQRSIDLVREGYEALMAGDAERARERVAVALSLAPADPVAKRAAHRLRDRGASGKPAAAEP